MATEAAPGIPSREITHPIPKIEKPVAWKKSTKCCPVCGEDKPATLDFFYKNRSGLTCWCKACYKTRDRGNKIAVNSRAKKYRDDLRLEVLIAYSTDPPSCACCAEAHLQFLALDHTHGGGNAHRRSIKNGAVSTVLYRLLKKQGFPNGFRVLCHNCNMAKGMYGRCPHEHI